MRRDLDSALETNGRRSKEHARRIDATHPANTPPGSPRGHEERCRVLSFAAISSFRSPSAAKRIICARRRMKGCASEWLRAVPGAEFTIGQPASHQTEHMVSGQRSALATTRSRTAHPDRGGRARAMFGRHPNIERAFGRIASWFQCARSGFDEMGVGALVAHETHALRAVSLESA